MPIPAGYTPINAGLYMRNSDASGPYMLNADGTMSMGLPRKLYTDSDGNYARLRVDVGQTGFFAGREFYTFYDFSVPNGQLRVIRINASVDTFLQEFGVELDTSKLQMELYSGGTATGPLDTVLPVIKTNQTASVSNYVSQITMIDNGTGFSGGTMANLFRADSSAKGVAGMGSDNPFGFPIGTYHIVLRNVGGTAAAGIFRARWEERP